MKKLSVFILVLVGMLCVTLNDASAQKKTPSRTRAVRIDSVSADSTALQNKANLPSLQLKEYTITGTERVRVLPTQRNPVNMSDYTRRESVRISPENENRAAPGAGGEKQGRDFEKRATGVVNEAYAFFGKYSDMNLGAQFRRKYERNELYADIDFKRSSGHVENADFQTISGSLTDVRPIRDVMQNRARVLFNAQSYKFYGSTQSIAPERSGFYTEIANITDIVRWDAVQMSVEGGARYYNPDETEIFNWNVWTKLNMTSVQGSNFFQGAIEWSTDRTKDGMRDNAPLNDGSFGKAMLTIERLITPRIHLKAGGAVYMTSSNNAQWIYDNSLSERGYSIQMRDIKETQFYPIGVLTFDFGTGGRFFAEYQPTISPFSLLGKLRYNQFLLLSGGLSHERVSYNLKIGWRRSYVHDLSFEIYYNDKKIEEFGIPVNRITNTENGDFGDWEFLYGNRVDVNEFRGAVSWNPDPKFSAWGAVSYSDYFMRESDLTEIVPYNPEMTGEISLQYMPGWGTHFVLDGQYIDERSVLEIASPFPLDVTAKTLDTYMIANLTVTKQWSRSVSSLIYVYNLFNEEYQVWNGYQAPDMVAGGGFRFFW